MRIARVVRETADAVTLVLEDARGAPVRFSAGQFFTLFVPLPGGAVAKRAYSASSSALDDGRVSVTVKRVEGGRVSTHLVKSAREGDVIDVLGPSGSFVPAPCTGPRRLVLVAGGSGITPLASIARTLLAAEPQTHIALVYGNRAWEDVILREALGELAREHGSSRFVLRHVLERAPAGWVGGTGLLDGAALARELDTLGEPDAPTTAYFLCGPAPMMQAARACLEARGVAPTRIHEERFVSAHAAGHATDVPQPVTVRARGGGERRIVVAPGQTLLEAATGEGVELPFSCTVGGCGACRVRLLEGKMVLDEPNCLSPAERAQGYVLTCIGRPAAPCAVEVP
jgi:ferredoxin-NADP reductase